MCPSGTKEIKTLTVRLHQKFRENNLNSHQSLSIIYPIFHFPPFIIKPSYHIGTWILIALEAQTLKDFDIFQVVR